jgi:phage terminase large subunit-like protein
VKFDQPTPNSLFHSALEHHIGQMLPPTDDSIDPLRKLMDPTFFGDDDGMWHYEHSYIGSRIPAKLHKKQNEALANPAKHRFLFWGNQTGKTTVGAVDSSLLALGRHPTVSHLPNFRPPVTIWASALSWELWQNVLLPELLTWIPRSRIVDAPEPFVDSNKRHIIVRADNGKLSRITGKSADQGPSRYQSARLHQLWADEEHPEPIWNEIQPRLLRFGGRTLNTMTPLLGLTWVHSRIYEPYQRAQLKEVA